MIDLYYAEDDETVAQAVKEYLEQENFRVTVFSMLAGMKREAVPYTRKRKQNG